MAEISSRLNSVPVGRALGEACAGATVATVKGGSPWGSLVKVGGCVKVGVIVGVSVGVGVVECDVP